MLKELTKVFSSLKTQTCQYITCRSNPLHLVSEEVSVLAHQGQGVRCDGHGIGSAQPRQLIPQVAHRLPHLVLEGQWPEDAQNHNKQTNNQRFMMHYDTQVLICTSHVHKVSERTQYPIILCNES